MDIEAKFKLFGKSARNLVLGVAIFILTMFVVVYGMNTFYEKPEYSDFCDEFKTAQVINTEQECLDTGGKWNAYEAVRPVPVGEETITGYCDRDFNCREEYEDAQEKRSKFVFIIAIPLGILIIALGAFVFQLNAVGIGLMFGGIGTLIYGSGGYWRYADNLFKFIISLVGLVVLIFLAYWFNGRIGKKKK